MRAIFRPPRLQLTDLQLIHLSQSSVGPHCWGQNGEHMILDLWRFLKYEAKNNCLIEMNTISRNTTKLSVYDKDVSPFVYTNTSSIIASLKLLINHVQTFLITIISHYAASKQSYIGATSHLLDTNIFGQETHPSSNVCLFIVALDLSRVFLNKEGINNFRQVDYVNHKNCAFSESIRQGLSTIHFAYS